MYKKLTANADKEVRIKKYPLKRKLFPTNIFVEMEEEEEKAPEKAAPEIQAKQEAPPAQESKPVAGPPPGWSVESKALYASLPDPIKQDILKREGEVSKGFKEYSEKTKRHDEIEQVLAPVRPFLQQIGVQNDAEAIRRLLQWENRIRSNPAQAIPELARQYGVDLSQTAQSNPVPPELKPVVDQFGNIANDVQYLKSELQRRDQTAAAESLAQFAKDKPHFESVKTDMGYLMMTAANSGRSLSLDDAYQQAIWAKPEIREQLIKEQIAKESKPTPIQKAQHARATAVSPSIRAPSAPQVNGAKKGTGVRGSLLDAVRELQDRERA